MTVAFFNQLDLEYVCPYLQKNLYTFNYVEVSDIFIKMSL